MCTICLSTGENAEVQKQIERLKTAINEVKKELENQKVQFARKLEEVETEREKNKKELQSVENKITEQGNSEGKESLLGRKEELLRSQWKLDENKKNWERQLLNIEKGLEPIEILLAT